MSFSDGVLWMYHDVFSSIGSDLINDRNESHMDILNKLNSQVYFETFRDQRDTYNCSTEAHYITNKSHTFIIGT